MNFYALLKRILQQQQQQHDSQIIYWCFMKLTFSSWICTFRWICDIFFLKYSIPFLITFFVENSFLHQIKLILFEAKYRSIKFTLRENISLEWKYFVSQRFPKLTLFFIFDTQLEQFEEGVWSEQLTIVIWTRLFGVGCSYMLYNRRLNIKLAKRPVATTTTTTTIHYYYCYCCYCSYALIIFLTCFVSFAYFSNHSHTLHSDPCTHAIPRRRTHHTHSRIKRRAAPATAMATRSYAWLNFIAKNQSPVQRQFRYGFFFSRLVESYIIVCC